MITLFKFTGIALIAIGAFFTLNNFFLFLDFGIQMIPCLVAIALGYWLHNFASKMKKRRENRMKAQA